uniref:LITAF domain-containing protein n=1 Tax=Steinernema glaseri TaxID=37863 RepID=A0A1I7ZAE2_9BILA
MYDRKTCVKGQQGGDILLDGERNETLGVVVPPPPTRRGSPPLQFYGFCAALRLPPKRVVPEPDVQPEANGLSRCAALSLLYLLPVNKDCAICGKDMRRISNSKASTPISTDMPNGNRHGMQQTVIFV